MQSTNNISQQDIDAIQNTVKLCLKDLQDNTATSLEAATKSSQKTAAFNELSNFINILRGEPSVADLQNAAVIFDTLARQPEIPKETQTHCLETKEALNALVNTLNHVRTQPQDPKNQQKIESAFSNLKHTIETALKTPTNKSAWDMDNILSHVFNGVLLLGAAVVCASMIVLPVAIQIIGLVIILVGVLAGVAAFGSISSIAMEHGRPSHF